MSDDSLKLQRLLSICSPAFPIGAFSYSGGLEAAVEQGALSDRGSLRAWCEAQLQFGGLRQDLWLVKAALKPDAGYAALCARALALRPTSELRLEARQQGQSLVRAAQKGWPELFIAPDKLDWALPVAFGWAAARLALSAEISLTGYAHAACANLLSAAVRSVPLGQSDAVHTQAALEQAIQTAVTQVMALPGTDEPPTATPRIDLYSAQHEVQYSRMFRS